MKMNKRGNSVRKKLSAILAIAMVVSLFCILPVTVLAGELGELTSADVTYSNSIGRWGGSSGTEILDGDTIPEDKSVYLASDYQFPYGKMINEMRQNLTPVTSGSTICYKIPMDTLVVPETVADNDILVNVDGVMVTVGTYGYRDAATAESMQTVIGDGGAGMYLIFKYGETSVDQSSRNGLAGLLQTAMGADVNEPTFGWDAVFDDLTASGNLNFQGTLDMSGVDYSDAIEFQIFNETAIHLKYPNPNPLSLPEFAKTGNYDAENGTITWNITIDRTVAGNYPDSYLIEDVFPAGVTLAGADAVKVKTTQATGDETTNVVMDANLPPAENHGYYNSTTRALTLNVKFDGETKKEFSIVTKVTPAEIFNGKADDGSTVTITNEAKLTSNELTGVDKKDDTTIEIPRSVSQPAKTGIFDMTSGKIKWKITVNNVNTAWLENLVVYDRCDDAWKLSGSVKINDTDLSVPTNAAAFKSRYATQSVDPLTDEGKTTAGGGDPIKSGFILTLFDYNNDQTSYTGLKTDTYVITYETEPVDPNYWETYEADNPDGITNSVWLSYGWLDTYGDGKPGQLDRNPPQIDQVPISSTAIKKSSNGNYNPATQLFTWDIVVNPHKIPMDTGAAVTMTDTMGKDMQLFCEGLPQPDVGSSVTLNGTTLSALFGASVAETIQSAEYSNSTDAGYVLTVSFDPMKINGQSLSFSYKTKVIKGTDVAGNVSDVPYKNQVRLNYQRDGHDIVANSEATNKLNSKMIEKSGEYLYENGAAGTGYNNKYLIKWTLKVNQNKMNVTDHNNGAWICDTIADDQDFVISPDTPVKITDQPIISSVTDPPASQDSSHVSYADKKLMIYFGKAENINGKELTITFYTKINNVNEFFKNAQNTVLETATAYNGKTEIPQDGALFCNDLNPEGVEADANVVIRNDFIQKIALDREIDDPTVKFRVGLNPQNMKIPENFTIEDKLSYGITLNPSSFKLYKAYTNEDGVIVTKDSQTPIWSGSNTGEGNKYGILTVGTYTDASDRICSKFSYNFDFVKSVGWSATANTWTYMLEYEATVDNLEAVNETYSNSVGTGTVGFTGFDASCEIEYSYNSANISSYTEGYGKITVTKQDMNTNAPLDGAVFTLTDASGQSKSATTNTSGIATFYMLIPGNKYTLKETTSPIGHLPVPAGGLLIAENIEITTTGTNNYTYTPTAGSTVGTLEPALSEGKNHTFVVYNHAAPFTISFAKRDQYGRAVVGATFGVYYVTDDEDAKQLLDPIATSDNRGNVLLDLSELSITTRTVFKIRELSAPAGINFDPETAPYYYFSIDQYGTASPIYTNNDLAGTAVSVIRNKSTTAPPTTPLTPADPATPGTPSENTTNNNHSSNTSTTPTIVVKANDPAAIAQAALLQSALLAHRALPKTGGMIGSIILFVFGGLLTGCGIYLNPRSKGKRKNHEDIELEDIELEDMNREE